MSTRCNIHFCYGDTVVANIYRHSDGYPKGVLPDLEKFFEAIETECGLDTRFNDPEYLAARFLVWSFREMNAQMNEYPWRSHKPKRVLSCLDVLGFGVAGGDHGDIDFVYEIDCSAPDSDSRPKVRWKHPGYEIDTWYEGIQPEEVHDGQ